MKAQLFIILIVVGFGCKDNGTGPTTIINLIPNSTFESNGIPSLNGWYEWNESDTSIVDFSSDVPSGGGGFSVRFQARQYAPCPNNSVYAKVTTSSGNHRYRLSVYGKRNGVGGSISVYVGYPPCEVDHDHFVTVPITDTVWTLYSFSDTLRTVSTDTIYVLLFGGGTEITDGTTFFNTCKFEKLD